MGKVWAALKLIGELIKLLKQFMGWVDDLQEKKQAEKTDTLNKAVDASKVARTDEEIFNAQKTIVDNQS